MNKREFAQKYLEAVHKAALGVHIIRIKGPQMGFNEKTLSSNEEQLIQILADGVGLSVNTVQGDVYDQVDHFPRTFFNRSDVKRVMGGMISQMQNAGLLT